MKIVALKTFRDHRGSFRRGMPGDVPDAFAKELIKAKLAELDPSEAGKPQASRPAKKKASSKPERNEDA